MKRFFKSLFIAIPVIGVLCSETTAATLYSRANGAWGTAGTWSTVALGGVSCGCTPGTGDIIVIGNGNNINYNALIKEGSGGFPNTITINANSSLSDLSADFEVKSGATLNVCGTLKTRNLTFDNGSFVNVCPAGYLNATGNFENKNNSNHVVIDGNMTVGGDFKNGNGGVISGTGGISITGSGSFNNPGTTFGCTGSGCCVGPPCVLGIFTLPIELLYFSAQAETESVKISWATASEINNDHFLVERSIDGKSFESVARIGGAGNTTIKTEYHVTDDDMLRQTTYYRLKQTDFDGTSTYSDLVAVENINASEGLSIYPNPTHGAFNIVAGSQLKETITISIVDLIGRHVINRTIVMDGPIIKINERLEKGVYTVFLKSEKCLFSEKLIVQ